MKITDKQWERFTDFFQTNPINIAGACNYAGISTNAYYKKRIDDPDFAWQVDQILDQVHLPLVENALITKAVNEKDGPSQRFFLSRRGGKRWNPEPEKEEIGKSEQFVPEMDPPLEVAVMAHERMRDITADRELKENQLEDLKNAFEESLNETLKKFKFKQIPKLNTDGKSVSL